MTDFDNQLLREAIINLKAKEYVAARRYLERALEIADDLETRVQANFYMSQVLDDPAEKRKYLEEALAYNPTHSEARRALAIMDGKLKPEDIVDADHLPAQSTETQNAKADRFACPKCGSHMLFDGDGRSLVCESCRREETLNTDAPTSEQDFIVAMATGQSQRKPVAMKTFKCKGCGAQFLLPARVISETCSYCGSIYVLAGTRELVEPDSIIPMAFNQREAARYLVQWVEKHKITPDGMVQPPRGLYLPVWTFDIFGSIPWSGLVYQEKQAVSVSGEKPVSFDDIIIYGTPKLADLLPKIITGFSLGIALAYDPRYLAGWPAEIYETPMAQASLEARKQAAQRARGYIRSEVSGIDDLNCSTANIGILSFKLVLIPVWVTEYSLEGRTFRVVINGQTGNVFGETHLHGILGWLEDVLQIFEN